jgi:3-deoxy-D-manno-octulosonic-acid transferase
VLANARLSQKSLIAARRWRALMRPAARGFARILAQTDADAGRFALLTERDPSEEIVTVGNVKFDVDVSDDQRALGAFFREAIGDAPVFLCASTRDGEEERILDAWVRRGSGHGVVLVLVPRHPQRFDAVAELVRARGLVFGRRSDPGGPPHDMQVWLGDSMGELVAHYLAADVAYIGGSIVPLGGQNLIEAAAAGCPILIGRHTFNFAAASDEAVAAGAALRVDDYDALVASALALAHDAARRGRMRAAGLAFAAAHRGATTRTVAFVEALVDSRSTNGS